MKRKLTEKMFPNFKGINIKHCTRYIRFIESRPERKLVKETGYEIHHIIPKSLGGADEDYNLIKLTYREHFIAHLILWKLYGRGPMCKAFFFMTKRVKNSNHYSRLKEEFSLSQKGALNPRYGKSPYEKMSDEQKEKLFQHLRCVWARKSRDEIERMTRKRLESLRNRTPEEKEKTREKKSNSSSGEKNGFFNKKHNEEARQKISKGNTGKRRSEKEKALLSQRNRGSKNSMYGRTYYSIWEKKYGKDKAEKKLVELKEKLSIAHKGKTLGPNNGMWNKIPKNALNIFWVEENKTFSSLSRLAKESNISPYLIRKIIYNNHKLEGYTFIICGED